MTCPQCGTSNEPQSRFCRACGAALGGASQQELARRHWAPTGTALLAAAGVTALVVLIILAAGATFAFRAYSHRGPAQPGGIRPASAPAGTQPPSATPSPEIPHSPLTPPAGTPGPPAPPAGAPQAPPASAPASPAPPAVQPPSAPSPSPPPPSGGEAAVPMAEYRAPSGQWRITYPQAWHVKESPNGAAVFYLDDPDEGTGYAVIPYATAPGEIGPRDLLEQLAASIRQEYPDLQVTVRSVRDVGQAAVLEAAAQWTGARRQAMRASIVLYVFTMRGSGYTAYSFVAGQAPAIAFNSMESLFAQMTQSFGR